MKDHWLVWSGALSRSWCEDVIQRGLSQNLVPGKIGTNENSIDDTIRVSRISWFNLKHNKDIVETIMEFVN